MPPLVLPEQRSLLGVGAVKSLGDKEADRFVRAKLEANKKSHLD